MAQTIEQRKAHYLANKERYQANRRAHYLANREALLAKRKAAANYNPKMTKDAARRNNLKAKWGLTVEQFDAMVESQGGMCGVCLTDNPGVRSWHVDHCHRTGAIRGLLCSRCNTALGSMQDSPAILRRAAEYLERFLLTQGNLL